MSLKFELETWAAALKAYDEEDFEQSLELFSVRLRLFFLWCPISHSHPVHCRLVKNSHKHGPYLRYSRRA